MPFTLMQKKKKTMPNAVPSAFSSAVPDLQIVWDATSLRSLMFCPRSYQYGILQGWSKSAVDLEFGIFFASSVETFEKAILSGETKASALQMAVQKAVEDSYGWGGEYEDNWRCLGETKFRNSKGNVAKCPYSHKGKWFPGPGPHICGSCGSHTVTERRFAPVDRVKNRHTLILAVFGYCADQPDDYLTGGLKPYAFPDGTNAIELSFKIPLPQAWAAYTGETYILAGHLDGIKTNGEDYFISDNKTTKNALTGFYWKQYQPNIQVDTYDLVGTLLFPDLGISGVVIEATQITSDGARFGTQIYHRTEGQREETFDEIQRWIKHAEGYAKDNYWPMNKTNCKMCPFNGICSKDPKMREMYLKADFTKRPRWNPAEER